MSMDKDYLESDYFQGMIDFIHVLAGLSLDGFNGEYERYVYDHFLALDKPLENFTVAELIDFLQRCFDAWNEKEQYINELVSEYRATQTDTVQSCDDVSTPNTDNERYLSNPVQKKLNFNERTLSNDAHLESFPSPDSPDKQYQTDLPQTSLNDLPVIDVQELEHIDVLSDYWGDRYAV